MVFRLEPRTGFEPVTRAVRVFDHVLAGNGTLDQAIQVATRVIQFSQVQIPKGVPEANNEDNIEGQDPEVLIHVLRFGRWPTEDEKRIFAETRHWPAEDN